MTTKDQLRLIDNDSELEGQINKTGLGSGLGATTAEQQAKRKKMIKWGLIGGAIVIVVVIVIVLSVVLTKGGDKPPNPPGGAGYNKYKTSDKEVVNSQDSLNGQIHFTDSLYNPELHYSANQRLMSSADAQMGVDTQSIPTSVKNNQLIRNIKFSVDMTDYQIARLTLTDADHKRFSIPDHVVNKPSGNNNMRLDMVGFSYELNPFSVTFKDASDNSNVFVTTKGQTLLLSDKYIQMDFLLPSQRLYGLGERVHEFQLTQGAWTMWASGYDSPYDDGTTGRKGTYGVHPFVMIQGKTQGDFFGMYFRNANAQTPVIKYIENGQTILSYITIGGQIEVYFFIHGNAKTIIQQYQNLVGKPYLPPYWALGWQQASWKYVNQSMVEEVIANYSNAGMNLETMYLDIPYMQAYSDFSVNTTAFPDMKGLVNKLHSNNQRIVPIIDGAFSADDLKNKYYVAGDLYDAFIKSGLWQSEMYHNNLISKVWPDKAVFIDWLNENSGKVINLGLDDLFRDFLQFDGLWIDMNEATTFKNGEITPPDAQPLVQQEEKEAPQPKRVSRVLEEKDNTNTSWYQTVGDQGSDSTYNLPFVPGFGNEFGNFDQIGMSLNATHAGWNNEKEYNLHSLYGHMMAWRFTQYVTGAASTGYNTDNRPFINSRSTFSGSGQYTSHWLGDNTRSWDYMRYSVHGMMNMNMFGIIHTGADVCGFFGEKKDDEMCARWIQLATFYPMARTHQNLTWKDGPSEFSEPYLLEGAYKTMAQKSIADRYQYLRHMYTCMFDANQNGGTCIDPLFYYYPQDENVYANYEETFIVGGALKVSPIYQALGEATTFEAYFPKGKWVSLINYNEIIDTSDGGKKVTLVASDTVQVHLREGTLFPFQDNTPFSGKTFTTKDLLGQPISIIVNPDGSGHASGKLFLDSGSSRSEINNQQYRFYEIEHNKKTLQFNLLGGKTGNFFAEEGENALRTEVLDSIWITNAETFLDADYACLVDTKFQVYPLTITQQKDKKALQITQVQGQPAVVIDSIRQVMYGNSKNNQDLNLCEPANYQYNIDGGVLPNLNFNNFTVNLIHPVLPGITLNVSVFDANIIYINYTWTLDKDGKIPAGKRIPYQIPQNIINTAQTTATSTYKLQRYITVTDKPFTINFKDNDQTNPANILSITGLIYDQYFHLLNITTNTPAADQFTGVFGLGQRANKDFFFKDGVYSMFDSDNLTPDEDGLAPGKQQYGTQPFFVFKHKSSMWAGVFSNIVGPQDWWIKNDQVNGQVKLTQVTTGGQGSLFIILGQQPDSIVAGYYSIVGNPVLQPNWALGWHQCRWGYKTLQMLDDVVKGYASNGIPLDVAWSDIDYKKNYRSFTYDNDRFKDLPTWLNNLHDSHMKWVPIVDIGIANRPGQDYPFVDDGYKKNVFQTIGDGKGEAFIGRVWPGDTIYPDFVATETPAWWQSGLDQLFFNQNITFDGLWLDMNENSNFCFGACYDKQQPANPIKNNLIYTPTGKNLEFKTLAMDVKDAQGNYQLDYHSLQSTLEVKASHEWFKKNDKRTFIISRSNSQGVGKFGNIWLGDNFATAENMGYSVTGVMTANMMGIGIAGADICGFIGDTTAELCARWHVLGSYYPFSRNHNNYGQVSQEPYVFKGQLYQGVDVMSIMKNAIYQKYSLNKYYYSQLTHISQNGEFQFFKPLFYAFPDDMNAYKDIRYNIMLGNSLKLSINSDSLGVDSTSFYFPAGTWCSIKDPVNDPCFVSTGQYFTKKSRAFDSYLHILQGAIVPYQNAQSLGIMTTYDLQFHPVDLHVHLVGSGNTWRAVGEYINDDGISLVNLTESKQNQYTIASQYNNQINVFDIEFSLKNNATDYAGKVEPGCSSVTANDFLYSIYFYNAKVIGINNNYQATATYNDGSFQFFAQGSYDTASDRLVFSSQKETGLCLSKMQKITFFIIPS